MRASSEPLIERETTALSECLAQLKQGGTLHVPLATYRLQFHKGFRFGDARALVPYLEALGVTHIYASPILEARPGSPHGYDIVNHERINPEIGGDEEFRALVADLKARGMGILLDTVPNHMGVGTGTPWWRDVLKHGRASRYADYFDIDWEPLKPELRDKLLLPLLGGQYGEELESGKLQVTLAGNEVVLTYYDHTFPLDPATLPVLFDAALTKHRDRPGEELAAFAALLDEFRSLPPHTSSDPQAGEERRRRCSGLEERWNALVQASPALREFIEQSLTAINGTPGNSRSFDVLHLLLELQVYRLAHWRVSGEEINYRRFFDINDLVGLRMENPAVFADSHRLLRRLLADGSITGLRVDHCDGMLNPRQYFIRAQMLFAASQCLGGEARPPLAENGIEDEIQSLFGRVQMETEREGRRLAPLYLVVEKILEPGEELPAEWPVAGTSGYDFVNQVNGLFVQGESESHLTRTYERFVGDVPPLDELIYDCKKLIMHVALASEVNVLSHLLGEISSQDRHARDFTLKTLRDAIRETIACFPVYRSYIDERGEYVKRDEQYINQAIARAKRLNAGMSSRVFDFLREILLLRSSRTRQDEAIYRRQLYFALKFQQLTGPVMAKGLEDTVFYRYNRFLSLNEVGGSPKHFGVPLDRFHAMNSKRAEQWPHSMLGSSTHDTKRSEDVRARLNVLSEMPRQWSLHALRARRTNAKHKITISDGRVVPDANEEYLLYQTLAGVWPWKGEETAGHEQLLQRVQQYMEKAVHEEKTNLSWINQNPEYIDALNKFIAAILAREPRPSRFVEQMDEFTPAIAFFGAINSLAQTLLKLTSPGLPDIYQGQELWDFSLVDPDNRRPVDYELRRRYARELAAVPPQDFSELCIDLLDHYTDGRVKMWTTMRALRLRMENQQLFSNGSYDALVAEGPLREHLAAYVRRHGESAAIVAVPRFASTLMKGKQAPPLGSIWGATELVLPRGVAGLFENVFTGEPVQITDRGTVLCRELFARFPVALLISR